MARMIHSRAKASASQTPGARPGTSPMASAARMDFLKQRPAKAESRMEAQAPPQPTISEADIERIVMNKVKPKAAEIEAIADKVYKQISQRFKFERQRRGY